MAPILLPQKFQRESHGATLEIKSLGDLTRWVHMKGEFTSIWTIGIGFIPCYQMDPVGSSLEVLPRVFEWSARENLGKTWLGGITH